MRQIVKIPRETDETGISDIINARIYQHNSYEGYFIREEFDDEECYDITYLIFDAPISLN